MKSRITKWRYVDRTVVRYRLFMNGSMPENPFNARKGLMA